MVNHLAIAAKRVTHHDLQQVYNEALDLVEDMSFLLSTKETLSMPVANF